MSGPLKRSVMIAGHATSVSLEPVFWDALEQAARELSLPVNALVARIDAERSVLPEPPNLASALRTWLFVRRSGRDGDASAGIGERPGGDPR